MAGVSMPTAVTAGVLRNGHDGWGPCVRSELIGMSAVTALSEMEHVVEDAPALTAVKTKVNTQTNVSKDNNRADANDDDEVRDKENDEVDANEADATTTTRSSQSRCKRSKRQRQ
eukprot:TRINITY_DN74572_c0_g1_i1.p2 TRINITY_DN74572_c0_g1~~TRINITY_DN74572_c0_g1_i1.p2  ORF type:complete len:115 (-),score=18.36 TRINITY_DN74572_c0_g1_i1:121-465(-)